MIKKNWNIVVWLIKLFLIGSVYFEKENLEKEWNMNVCKLYVVYLCFKKIFYVDMI